MITLEEKDSFIDIIKLMEGNDSLFKVDQLHYSLFTTYPNKSNVIADLPLQLYNIIMEYDFKGCDIYVKRKSIRQLYMLVTTNLPDSDLSSCSMLLDAIIAYNSIFVYDSRKSELPHLMDAGAEHHIRYENSKLFVYKTLVHILYSEDTSERELIYSIIMEVISNIHRVAEIVEVMSILDKEGRESLFYKMFRHLNRLMNTPYQYDTTDDFIAGLSEVKEISIGYINVLEFLSTADMDINDKKEIHDLINHKRIRNVKSIEDLDKFRQRVRMAKMKKEVRLGLGM